MEPSKMTDAELLQGMAENGEAITKAAKDRLHITEGRVTADAATRESIGGNGADN